MIRSILILTLTLGLSPFVAEAQISISYTGGPGESNVVNSAGAPINGDIVSIGTFLNFDPTLPGNASDLPALQAHWLNFDSTTTQPLPAFGTPVDGRFAGTSPSVNNAAFDHKQIYLWITEGSGNNITEYGLFSSNNPDWVFPAHDATPGSYTGLIDSNEINQFLFGDGIVGSGGSTPGSIQTLAVVPEPGTLSMLALGGLLFAGFRARRP